MSIPLEQTVPATLTDGLRDAYGVTAEFLSATIKETCRRFPSERSGNADRVEQLIQSQAWTDAALALIDLELPQWQVRRLAYDGGEWFCVLSRQREMPDWLDQPVETHRTDLPLAILDAIAQAKRISAPQNQASVTAPASVPPFFEPVCSENFG
jgi:hypothetical protein